MCIKYFANIIFIPLFDVLDLKSFAKVLMNLLNVYLNFLFNICKCVIFYYIIIYDYI